MPRLTRQLNPDRNYPTQEVMCDIDITSEHARHFGIPGEYADKLAFRVLFLGCGHYTIQDDDPDGNQPIYKRGDMMGCRNCFEIIQQHLVDHNE